MIGKMTPEKVIHIVWLSIAMSCCWPLPPNSKRNHKIAYQILHLYDIASAFTVILALTYSAHIHGADIVTVCKCLCCAIGVSQIIIQTIICRAKHDLLQHVVAEMVACINEAKEFEREIFCKYIAKCQMLYGCSIAFIYATTTVIALGPTVMATPFPMDVEYPFSVNNTSTYIILYIQQVILIYQGTAHLCLCAFGALLLWFAAARFECLAVELQKIVNSDMLIICIKKQLYLIGYAEDVTSCFRFVVFYAIAVNTLAMTLCGLLLIMNAPLIVKMQFAFLCFTALMEIYMYAWPADCLMEMSVRVSQSAYSVPWYKLNIELQKDLLNVLVYQKPIVLSVSFVLSELSLRYFCSFLSNAFSIFATLRAAVNDR